MGGRRKQTSRRQELALRQWRASGPAGGAPVPAGGVPAAIGATGGAAAGPPPPPPADDAHPVEPVDPDAQPAVSPDPEAHRAETVAAERLARARENAAAASASRKALQQRIHEQRSRLQSPGAGAVTDASPDAGAGVRPAGPPRVMPAWVGPSSTTTTGTDRATGMDRATTDTTTGTDRATTGAPRPAASERPAAAAKAPTGPESRVGGPRTAPTSAPSTTRTAGTTRGTTTAGTTTAGTTTAGTTKASPAASTPVVRRPTPPSAAGSATPAAVTRTGAPTAAPAAPASRDTAPNRRLLLFVVAVIVAVVALGLIRAQRDAPVADPVADAPPAATGFVGPLPGELRVEATLQDQSIDVQEETRFTADPPTQVQLRLPGLAELNGPIRTAQLSVVDLEVTVDGEQVQPQQDTPEPGTWTVQNPDGEPFTDLQVRYRLDGALLTNALSAPGRLLAVLGPLSAGASVGAADVAIRGDGVMNVYCPGQAADQLLCATATDDGWAASLPSPSPVEPVLLIQLDRG